MRLVLFDIDGTLMDSGGAGSRALGQAVQEVLGIRDGFESVRMAGKTDMQIIREALAGTGLTPGEEVMRPILGAYLRRLEVEIHNNGRHVKPGVTALLQRLSQEPSVSLGLLTGNVSEGARIKLAPFGLGRFFSANGGPLLGAFGDDDEDRLKLLPVAVRRYSDISGQILPYENCVVVGDTPMDVRCARPYGAASVAVATGPYGMDELRGTGADLVLGDLADAGPLLEFIL